MKQYRVQEANRVSVAPVLVKEKMGEGSISQTKLSYSENSLKKPIKN